MNWFSLFAVGCVILFAIALLVDPILDKAKEIWTYLAVLVLVGILVVAVLLILGPVPADR